MNESTQTVFSFDKYRQSILIRKRDSFADAFIRNPGRHFIRSKSLGNNCTRQCGWQKYFYGDRKEEAKYRLGLNQRSQKRGRMLRNMYFNYVSVILRA